MPKPHDVTTKDLLLRDSPSWLADPGLGVDGPVEVVDTDLSTGEPGRGSCSFDTPAWSYRIGLFGSGAGRPAASGTPLVSGDGGERGNPAAIFSRSMRYDLAGSAKSE